MFFKDISWVKPLREAKMVPIESSVLNTLVRHGIITMRCLRHAWRVILTPIDLTQAAISMYFSRELQKYFSINYCAGEPLR